MPGLSWRGLKQSRRKLSDDVCWLDRTIWCACARIWHGMQPAHKPAAQLTALPDRLPLHCDRTCAAGVSWPRAADQGVIQHCLMCRRDPIRADLITVLRLLANCSTDRRRPYFSDPATGHRYQHSSSRSAVLKLLLLPGRAAVTCLSRKQEMQGAYAKGPKSTYNESTFLWQASRYRQH